MSISRQVDRDELRTAVQSAVLDVLRRRAKGEALPDELVIASHPDLAEHLPAELKKLQQIFAAEVEADGRVNAETVTADIRAISTPGVIQVRCPHCREPFETPTDTPVTEIVCSACGGHFSLAGADDDTRAARPLQSLAHFDLVERLGVGGFGTVWKARDSKLDRTVAVKIPRHQLSNAEDLEKFLREARAAAQLQHPNIVRVHEVGRDGDSVFIVSDFVRGVALNDWLTAHQPTTRQSAELCLTVAEALQHAHDRGVIHRDLKPSNILMDGDGQPHLMDFGLARREIGEVTVTMDGQLLGTPAYMSPEQARGEAHTADRRADIYSLGVILFQLLTGELPFRGNAQMLIHQVVHEDPPSPTKFNSTIPKDLETITLKCLEKSPEQRYATARELADEFKRYLAGEPIRARSIGRAARAWRWAKRRPTAAALLALLVLVAAGSTAAFMRERALYREVAAQKHEAESRKADADSERDNAEAVVNFLTQDVLGKASPEEVPDKAVRDVLVKSLIEPAATNVGERFDDKPLIEAAIQHTLAETLLSLGRSDLAITHAERSLDLRRKFSGENHPDTIASLNQDALVLKSLGRMREAEPLFKQALEQRRSILGPDDPDTLVSLNNYALILGSLGRESEAEPLHKQALDQSRRIQGEDDLNTVQFLQNYAGVLLALGRAREAEPLSKQALEQYRKIFGDGHPRTIAALAAYASMLKSVGRSNESEPLLHEALEKSRSTQGDEHPSTISLLINYAAVLESLGRAKEAEPLFKLGLEQRRKVLGEDHHSTVTAINNYAFVLLSLGRAQEAEALLKQALDKHRKLLGNDHPTTIQSLNNYAFALNSLRRPREARPLYEEAFKRSQQVLGDQHPGRLRTMVNYASVLQSLGELDQAEPLLKQAHEMCRKTLGDDHPQTISSLSNYADVLWSLARPAEAESLYKQVMEQREKTLGKEHAHTVESVVTYAQTLRALGRVRETEPYFERALEQNRRAMGEDHGKTLQLMSNLASARRWNGRLDECAKLRDELRVKIMTLTRKPTAWESYWAATALLAVGDLDENRRVCRQLLESFEESGDKDFAERASKAYVIAPVPEFIAKQVVAAAEAVKDWSAENERAFAASLFRAAQYEKALDAFKSVNAASKLRTRDHCFLAMVHAKLGNDIEAKDTLLAARNSDKQKDTAEWYTHVETELLLAEAASLVEGKSSDSTE